MNEIEKNAAPSVSKVLIGNKTDLDYKRAVTTMEGQTLAESLGMKFIETSAQQPSNVTEAFRMMARDVQAKIAKNPTSVGTTGTTFTKGNHHIAPTP